MRGNNYAKFSQSHKFARDSVSVVRAREAIQEGDKLRSMLAGKRVLEEIPASCMVRVPNAYATKA